MNETLAARQFIWGSMQVSVKKKKIMRNITITGSDRKKTFFFEEKPYIRRNAF